MANIADRSLSVEIRRRAVRIGVDETYASL